jgi:hypothetical protein
MASEMTSDVSSKGPSGRWPATPHNFPTRCDGALGDNFLAEPPALADTSSRGIALKLSADDARFH